MIGGFARLCPKWLRALIVVGGVFTVVLSSIIIVFPAVGVLTLVLIISVALLWNGIDAIVAGITATP